MCKQCSKIKTGIISCKISKKKISSETWSKTKFGVQLITPFVLDSTRKQLPNIENDDQMSLNAMTTLARFNKNKSTLLNKIWMENKAGFIESRMKKSSCLRTNDCEGMQQNK